MVLRVRERGGVEETVSKAGCGSAWLERLVWDQEAAGSNPVTPIERDREKRKKRVREDMREWLRGGAPPCQGGGRGFESRLALFLLCGRKPYFTRVSGLFSLIFMSPCWGRVG